MGEQPRQHAGHHRECPHGSQGPRDLRRHRGQPREGRGQARGKGEKYRNNSEVTLVSNKLVPKMVKNQNNLPFSEVSIGGFLFPALTNSGPRTQISLGLWSLSWSRSR